MTPLADILARRIAATGPLTLADYMSECLLHPEHGYYTTRDPLGVSGDFTTAPEISQMFGELVGLSLAQCWIDQGSPDPFQLVELGPGRGTLMADILRATNGIPGFVEAARLSLVEASSPLRAMQQDILGPFTPSWLNDVSEIPDGPVFLIANEFFDALPVRQFRRSEKGWREVQIGVKDNHLAFGLSADAPIAVLDHRLGDTKPNDVVEICASAQSIIGEIARRIASFGGAALIFDYGDWRSLGDTFQALKDHTSVNALSEPGLADLTAHVDFEALSVAATNVEVTDMVPQGILLERLGITPRAQALAQNLSGKALESHIAAHRRLTHPDEMGTLFKAIAFHQNGTPPPPGFAS